MAFSDFYTGGGDDAAANEAQRVANEDALREVRMAQDRAKINALFGLTDYDYTSIPNLFEARGVITPEQYETEGMPGLGAFGREAVPQGLEKTLQSESELVPRLDPDDLLRQATENKATRQGTLEGIYQDILNNSMYQLDTQFDRKTADTLAMLADRGISRSTVGQTTMDRLGEIYDTQESGFQQTAEQARQRVRGADEDTRLDLISMINAGGDYSNAAANAASKMETNTGQAYDLARTQNLTNLFSEMNELYGQKQYVDAYNTGQKYGSTNLVTPGSASSSGSSGRVLNY